MIKKIVLLLSVICFYSGFLLSFTGKQKIEEVEIVNEIIEEEKNDILDFQKALVFSGCNPDKYHLELIYSKSQEEGLDFFLILALVGEESSFNQYEVSRNKDKSMDYGLFQLNDRWHPQFKDDIEEHINYGIEFFVWCLEVEDFDETRALSRYNTGKPNTTAGIKYSERVYKRKFIIENNFCKVIGRIKTRGITI